MAVTPVLLVKTITTAGTQVQVTTDTDVRPAAVYFEALASNTGVIYIGDADVSSTNYMAKLGIPSTTSSPSWSLNAPAAGLGRIGATGIQLSNLWVDSSVSGEKVCITYVYETGG
jgi:hypothetical protein